MPTIEKGLVHSQGRNPNFFNDNNDLQTSQKDHESILINDVEAVLKVTCEVRAPTANAESRIDGEQ
jgi:hypothetical protein